MLLLPKIVTKMKTCLFKFRFSSFFWSTKFPVFFFTNIRLPLAERTVYYSHFCSANLGSPVWSDILQKEGFCKTIYVLQTTGHLQDDRPVLIRGRQTFKRVCKSYLWKYISWWRLGQFETSRLHRPQILMSRFSLCPNKWLFKHTTALPRSMTTTTYNRCNML